MPRLLQARNQYLEWEAVTLWVRAIEAAEGDFPEWLAEIVDKRCKGFVQFVAEYKLEHPETPPSSGITSSAGLTSTSSAKPGEQAR